MISNDEKNIFLQDLEEESLKKKISKEKKIPQKKKRKMSATAIFAAFSVFFIFIVLLMVFVLSLAGTGNPVFKTFGIEPYQIKSFLTSLLNNSFLVMIILFLLATAIGIFRGYSTPKEETKKKRNSFIFSSVSGALIFLSLLSWGGAYAFIDKFVAEKVGDTNAIEVLNADTYTEKLTAPLDITFSLKKTLQKIKKSGKKIESVKWSSDGGNNFYEDNNWETNSFHFTTKGRQEIVASVLLTDGTEEKFSRIFVIDKATFSSPPKIYAKKKATFNATKVVTAGKRYLWDFDGDKNYEKSTTKGIISHIFQKPGTYDVELRVELPQGSFQIFTKKIRVYSKSEKSLVATISSEQEFAGEAPFTIELSGEQSYSEDEDIVSYKWILGKDKNRRNGKNITYTFENPGRQSVIMTVTNKIGASASQEIFVEVSTGNAPPKAFITTIPKNKKKNLLEGKTPFEVEFSGEKSTDVDKNIVDYNWIIEDEFGEKEKLSGNKINYTFRKEGIFSVHLTVTDEKNASHTQSMQVIVEEPTVFAETRATPNSGNAPLIVSFDGSESTCKLDNCRVTGFEWDFMDDTPIKRTGSKISHLFKKAGQYPVSMTAHTNLGEQNTSITYVNVSETIFKACFESSRTKGVVPVKITFDPSCSQGEISEYKWSFGDGKISQIKRPSHVFQSAGKFSVTLHTIDKNGGVSESSQTISVTNAE